MLRGLPPRYDPTEDEAGKRELFASVEVAEDFQCGIKGQVADYQPQNWQRGCGRAAPISSWRFRFSRA